MLAGLSLAMLEAGLYGAMFAASVAAYVIVTAPGLLGGPLPWLRPLRLVSLGTPAMFWLFALAAFDDAFVASWRHALPWLGTVAIGFVCARGLVPAACPLYHALQLMFVALAIRQALVGRSADLIEERRRFRVALVLSSAIYTAAVIVLETFMGGPPASPPLSTVNAAGVLALTFVFVFTQLSLSARGQLIPVAPVVQRGFPVDASPRSDAAAIDGQEAALLERLRRLINQRLGHRNFSTFVNGYRLADAMGALADRTQAQVPILTIALDAGFQSLGPFNRAFKAHTGTTPSDYRRLHLGRLEPPPDLADSGIGKSA